MGMVYAVAIPMTGFSITVAAAAGPKICALIDEHLTNRLKLWVRSSQVFFGDSARFMAQSVRGWRALCTGKLPNIDLRNIRLPKKDGHQD
jgi:hypothetical protein